MNVLPFHEQTAIQARISEHFMAEERQLDADVPVTLHAGGMTFLVGALPDVDPELLAIVLEDVVKSMRKQLLEAAAAAQGAGEAEQILKDWAPELTEAIKATEPDGEPAGPIVRVLREQAGMSRSKLARAIGRDRGAVARWEAGRSSGLNIRDTERAAAALGYSAATVFRVGTALWMPIERGPYPIA
jgi:DNA-binding transcriptional regulator YiaG